MIWDRLGVISDEVSNDFIEALDWIQAEGLKYVEIRMVDGINVANLSDEQVERVHKEVVNRRLCISALASPYLNVHLIHLGPLKREIDLGKRRKVLMRILPSLIER